MGRCEASLVSWGLRLMQLLPVCWLTGSMTFSDAFMVSSLDSHVVVGRSLSRNVALALGADQIVSVCTPGDDHYVELMAGASAGPGWRRVCGSNDVSDVVPNGSAHRFFWIEAQGRSTRGRGSRVDRRRSLQDAKGRQRPFPILDDHVEPVEGVGVGLMRSESGQLESPANADTVSVCVC